MSAGHSKENKMSDATIPLESATTSGERSGNRTALITGAASGIGLELTRLLAADGYNVILLGEVGMRKSRNAD
jgi:NADPH:quinone reductase-like Zn-dependent oxidoreductase